MLKILAQQQHIKNNLNTKTISKLKLSNNHFGNHISIRTYINKINTCYLT
jgi:hypothetical protein